MAFKAGAIYGEAILDTKRWRAGLGRLTKGIGIAVAAAAAAFSAAMIKFSQAGDEFQKAMSNVATLVDTNVVNMQDLARQVLTLNPALGDATEITNGLYQAFSAGAPTAEAAMETTITSAKFARAALTDTNTAVDVLTTAVNAYGSETITAQKASDLFFQTIKLGKTTGEELAGTIGQSIPLFASAGIAMEELTAGLAAMTKQGVNSANATTQLNAIVNAFLKPSDEMVETLERMGYVSGSAFLEAEGLAGALKLLQEETRGDAAAMATLIPNIRGLRGAMALTGVGGKTFTETLEAMGDASGSTAEAFEKQEKTFDTFRNSMKNVQIILGNIAKVFVDQLARGATTAANSLITFIASAQGMQVVSQVAATVGGAFGVIKEIVTPLLDVLKESLQSVWAKLVENLTKIVGKGNESSVAFKALSVVTNLLSSSLIIAAKAVNATIDAIGDLIVALRESAQTVGTFFQALIDPTKWKDVGKQAREAGDAFVQLGTGVIDNVGDLIDTVIDEFTDFGSKITETAQELEIAYRVHSENAAEFVEVNWGRLLTGFDDFIEGITQNFVEGTEGLEETSTDSSKEVIDTWRDAFNELRSEGNATYEQLKRKAYWAYQQGLIDQREYNEISMDLWREYFSGVMQTIQEYSAPIMSAISTITSDTHTIFSQIYTNAEAKLRNSLNRQLEALEEQREAGVLTEEQYTEKKEELEERYNEKFNEVAEKQFKADKANKLAQVWMDTAQAIQSFWASSAPFGPIAGPAFASTMSALVTASAIAQSALIGKQEFVPSLQEGGRASGVTRINEAGGEIVTLPDGSQVIPYDISREIARAVGANRGNIFNVSFDGAKISNDMDLDRIVEVVSSRLGRKMRLAV